MSDIIATLTWHDPDLEKAGESGWTQTFYWMHDTGEYTEADTDGNHEPVEPDEIPRDDEIAANWLKYDQHVAETGDDPLGTYLVNYDRKARWCLKFRRSIVGYVVISAREHGKKAVTSQYIPNEVAEYFMLKRNVTGTCFYPYQPRATNGYGHEDDLVALAEQDSNCKVTKRGPYIYITARELSVPRSEIAVRRELMKIARKSLRAHKKNRSLGT